jgi:serine/threonine protein kinase
LDKLLYDSNVKLNEEYKIQLVRGIAAGMLHLHKHNIVHRDLAARNILLTSSGDPKISVLFVFCFISFDLLSFYFLND